MKIKTIQHSPNCPSEIIIRILRGRWVPALLMVIGEHGPLHFLAIAREIEGISAKVLSEQLRYLVDAGVFRRITHETRREVEYELTPRGAELRKTIESFNELASRWPAL